ncbi:hypothetical protein P7K49_002101 [Saguinus oedipus]|uniref:Uncharacterized protein n=1 Tax=Saguinus oedipus TaxID=9490 RepID=A0ABQ9WGU9_SAGOE|nr:hypothetical protein P7K49_002101 [Saguinus oedipus]
MCVLSWASQVLATPVAPGDPCGQTSGAGEAQMVTSAPGLCSQAGPAQPCTPRWLRGREGSGQAHGDAAGGLNPDSLNEGSTTGTLPADARHAFPSPLLSKSCLEMAGRGCPEGLRFSGVSPPASRADTWGCGLQSSPQEQQKLPGKEEGGACPPNPQHHWTDSLDVSPDLPAPGSLGQTMRPYSSDSETENPSMVGAGLWAREAQPRAQMPLHPQHPRAVSTGGRGM